MPPYIKKLQDQIDTLRSRLDASSLSNVELQERLVKLEAAYTEMETRLVTMLRNELRAPAQSLYPVPAGIVPTPAVAGTAEESPAADTEEGAAIVDAAAAAGEAPAQ